MNLWPAFFLTFCPDQCWSGKKLRTKVFNWSEVHLYQSSFLQNPYFKGPSILLVKNVPTLLIFSWSYACLKMHLCRMAAAPVVLDHEGGTNLKIWPKILPQNVEQCAAHASKITDSIRFLVQEHNEAKIYVDFNPKCSPKMWSSVQLMHPNYTFN